MMKQLRTIIASTLALIVCCGKDRPPALSNVLYFGTFSISTPGPLQKATAFRPREGDPLFADGGNYVGGFNGVSVSILDARLKSPTGDPLIFLVFEVCQREVQKFALDATTLAIDSNLEDRATVSISRAEPPRVKVKIVAWKKQLRVVILKIAFDPDSSSQIETEQAIVNSAHFVN